MDINNLLNNVEFLALEAAAVAGTSTLTSDVVDTADCIGVCFVAKLGDVTSGCVLSLTAFDSESDSTGFDDLEGPITFTAGASDADQKFMVLDVVRPEKRYVRVELGRGSQNAVVDGIWAIKYGLNHRPKVSSAILVSDTLANPARA